MKCEPSSNRVYFGEYQESGGKEYSEIAGNVDKEDPTVIKEIRKSWCDLREQDICCGCQRSRRGGEESVD